MSEHKVRLRDAWLETPTNPWLISYPRSGRHWLCTMVERITGKSTNYYDFPFSKEGAERLWLPLHNLDFSIKPRTVVYLYRKDPVNVIYSWLPGPDRNLDDVRKEVHENDEVRIHKKTDLITNRISNYAEHIDHYLFQQDYIEDLHVLSYEDLEKDSFSESCKLLDFLGESYSTRQVKTYCDLMTRDRIARVTEETGHGWVVTEDDYFDVREQFREKYKQLVIDTVLKGRPHLREVLDV